MNTDPEILANMHDILGDVLLPGPPANTPVINFYSASNDLLATITYDGFERIDSDAKLEFLSGSSNVLFATAVTTGDVAIFRIQDPSGSPADFLFSGSVGLTGHGADITFPDTYWPINSTIVIDRLRMYVKPGSVN